jgi:hypothetical protein
VAVISASPRRGKISVSGGSANPICAAEPPLLGTSWDSSGIMFGQGSKGIMRVSATGGQPAVLVTVKNGELAHGPQILPAGWERGPVPQGAPNASSLHLVVDPRVADRLTRSQVGAIGHQSEGLPVL